MTPALPPTDGTHPNAQPVMYAHKPEWRHAQADWVRTFRNLLRDVASNPSVRREIDEGYPVEDSTEAVRAEFLALHGGEPMPKPKARVKDTIAEKSIAILLPPKVLPLPPVRPIKRDTTPRISQAAVIGVEVISCARCCEIIVRTGTTQKYCKPCALDVIREKKREEKRAKMPVEIKCKRCGCMTPRLRNRQNFCPSCDGDRADEHRAHCRNQRRIQRERKTREAQS